jgi:hypothetical protein
MKGHSEKRHLNLKSGPFPETDPAGTLILDLQAGLVQICEKQISASKPVELWCFVIAASKD